MGHCATPSPDHLQLSEEKLFCPLIDRFCPGVLLNQFPDHTHHQISAFLLDTGTVLTL